MAYSTLTNKITHSLITKMYTYNGVANNNGEKVYCKSGFTLGIEIVLA